MPKDNYIRKVLSAGMGSKSLNSNLQMRTETKLYPEIEIRQTIKNRLTQFTEPWDDETITGEDSDEVFAGNASDKEQEIQQRDSEGESDGGYRGEVSKKALHPEGEDISNRNATNTYSGNEDNIKDSQREIVEKSLGTGRNHIKEQNVPRKESEFKGRIPEVEIIKKPLMKEKAKTHSLSEGTQETPRKTQENIKIITPITEDDIKLETTEPTEELKQSKADSFLKKKENENTPSGNIQSAPGKQQKRKIRADSDTISEHKDLSPIRSREKIRVTEQTYPKVFRKEASEMNSDFKELERGQIYQSNDGTLLLGKERNDTPDSEISLPAKSSETKTIEGMKEKTEEWETLKVQPKGQKIMHQRERTFVSSSLKEKTPEYEINLPSKPVTIIQSPKDKTMLFNTNLYSESLKNNMNHILKIADNIAMIDEKLTAHIKKEHSKPEKPTSLPKRPPSRNLGGWNYLERSYLE